MKTFYYLLLAGWFTLGYFLCKNKLCPAINESSSQTIMATDNDCISTLIFKENTGTLDLSSSQNFIFKSSSAELELPGDELDTAISKVKAFLENNPDRFMQISGLYKETEENLSEAENLGLARATSIKSFLVANGFKSMQLTLNAKVNNELCLNDDKILQGASIAFGEIK